MSDSQQELYFLYFRMEGVQRGDVRIFLALSHMEEDNLVLAKTKFPNV